MIKDSLKILHLLWVSPGCFWATWPPQHLCWASASTGRGSTLQCRISRPEIEECLKYSLPLVPTVFLSWSNSQVDRLILLSLLRLGVLGVYGAAAKVAMIITVLVQVFRLAWLPIALSHIDQSSRNSYFRSSLIAYLAVMTCIGLVLVTYSREPLTLLTTSEYASGYVVIPWLVGAQIFYGSASITNIGMLIHADQ